MKILIEKVLSYLGCPPAINNEYYCPLHISTTPTLTITEDPITDNPWCTCSQCHFSGTILSLIATKKQLPINTVNTLFSPGNILQDAIIGDFNSDQLIEYLNPYINQALLEKYINNCNKNLLEFVTGKYLLERLSILHWLHPDNTYLPKGLGMVIHDEIPEELAELRKKDYKDNLIFSYTYNDQLTGIKTLNVDTSASTFIELRARKGVFLEQYALNSDTLFIAPDELSALSIHTRTKTRTAKALPVIAVNTLPLPSKLNTATKLYLLATDNRPVTLKTALQYLAEPVIDTVPNDKLDIFISILKNDVNNFDTDSLFTLDSKRFSVSLLSYVVNQLMFIYKTHGVSAIYNNLIAVSLNSAIREQLAGALKKNNADEKLISLITSNNSLIPEKRVLFNNMIVMRTPAGFIGYINETNTPLSNTTFRIKNKIITSTGDIYCNCTLQTNNTPEIQAMLNYRAFKNAKLLRQAVQAEYLKHNLMPTIVFYDYPGFSWSEICDHFSDSIQVQREITSLGVDEVLNLQLPNHVIITNGNIIKQNRIFEMDKNVVAQYSGLKAESTDLTIFKELWTRTDTYSKVFTLGIAHILYHMLLPRFIKNTETYLRPKHLCFIDSNEDRLHPLISRLNMLFANSEYEYKFLQHTFNKQLQQVNKLGTLPLICSLPNLNNKRTVKLFDEMHINLVSNITEDQAFALNRLNNISFVVDNNAEPVMPNITTDQILQLQNSFIALLSRLMLYHIEDKTDLITTTTPATMMHNIISIILNIPINTSIYSTIQAYYIDTLSNLDTLFLNALNRFIYFNDTEYHPTLINDEPNIVILKNYSNDPKVIIVGNKAVFMRIKLINFMNKLYECNLSVAGVQAQLRQKEMTIDNSEYTKIIPPNVHYIILKREVWDEHIIKKQPVKFIPKPVISVA